MRRIAEQHRRHRDDPQAVLLYRRYRNTVAYAAVDHLRLHGHNIDLKRPTFIVEEHRLYFILLAHPFSPRWTAGHTLIIIRPMLKFILS